ncbi:MAG TPA: BON domain-containing protein [Terriglobales bacterium]|nr:BON domain-containing protein [Terriglobales bacterium]
MQKLAYVMCCVLLASCCFAQSENTAQQQSTQTPASGSAAQQKASDQQETTALPSSRQKLGGTAPEARISREVLHELLMLPYYSVFDNLAYRVNGDTVTLIGQVVRPTLKSDAEEVVKRIEGVENVVNNIEVLPPSPGDDRIRAAVYRSIYGFDGLSRYSWGAVPSIHIIVRGGRVTLTGVVDNQTDKNLAGMRANLVGGVFAVTNNLQVLQAESKKRK